MLSMHGKRNGIAATITALVALIASTEVASAQDIAIEFPADTACSFGVTIEGTGGHMVARSFEDRDGNVIRTISAGRGYELTLKNQSTGATYTLSSSGAVIRTETNADGTQTVTATGHIVLILFPTDEPAGPSTTAHVGRVRSHVDADAVYTVQSTSGTEFDLCAALS